MERFIEFDFNSKVLEKREEDFGWDISRIEHRNRFDGDDLGLGEDEWGGTGALVQHKTMNV